MRMRPMSRSTMRRRTWPAARSERRPRADGSTWTGFSRSAAVSRSASSAAPAGATSTSDPKRARAASRPFIRADATSSGGQRLAHEVAQDDLLVARRALEGLGSLLHALLDAPAHVDARLGDDEHLHAAVGRRRAPLDEAAVLEPIDDARDVGVVA